MPLPALRNARSRCLKRWWPQSYLARALSASGTSPSSFFRFLLWAVATGLLGLFCVIALPHSLSRLCAIALYAVMLLLILVALLPSCKFRIRCVLLSLGFLFSIALLALHGAILSPDNNRPSDPSYLCFVPTLHLLWRRLDMPSQRYQVLPTLAALVVPLAVAPEWSASPIPMTVLLASILLPLVADRTKGPRRTLAETSSTSGSGEVSGPHAHSSNVTSSDRSQSRPASAGPLSPGNVTSDVRSRQTTPIPTLAVSQGPDCRLQVLSPSDLTEPGVSLSLSSCALMANSGAPFNPLRRPSGLQQLLIQPSLHCSDHVGTPGDPTPRSNDALRSPFAIDINEPGGPRHSLTSDLAQQPTLSFHPSIMEDDIKLDHRETPPQPSSSCEQLPSESVKSSSQPSSSEPAKSPTTGNGSWWGAKVLSEVAAKPKLDSPSTTTSLSATPAAESDPSENRPFPSVADYEREHRQLRELKTKFTLLKANFDEMAEERTKFEREVAVLKEKLASAERELLARSPESRSRSSTDLPLSPPRLEDHRSASSLSCNGSHKWSRGVPRDLDQVSQGSRASVTFSGDLGGNTSIAALTPTSRASGVSNLSHEMRTPLTTAIASLELLLDDHVPLSVDDRLDLLRKAWSSLRHLEGVINNLLGTGHTGSGGSRRVTLRRIAIRALRSVEPEAAEALIELLLEVDPAIPTCVLCDGNVLERLLCDLLSNAILETPANGRILLKMAYFRSAEKIVVSIDIEGHAFTADEFKAMCQSTPGMPKRGNWPQCHELAAKLGGFVSASTVGESGSRISFEFQVSATRDNRVPVDATVALLDRDAIRRQATTSLFRYFGVDVIHVLPFELPGAESSVRIVFISQLHPMFSEYAQQIRQYSPQCAVISIIPNNVDSSLKPDELSAIDGVLRSPIDFADVRAVLRKALKSEDTGTLQSCASLPSASGPEVSVCQLRPQPLSASTPFVVLLAEDNDINFKLFQKQLEGLGVTNIHRASNGVQAVELAQKNRYSVIVMDCQMPLLTGYDATAQIRTLPQHATTPVVALTANQSDENKRRCLAAGMTAFFSKPITKESWQQILAIANAHLLKSL